MSSRHLPRVITQRGKSTLEVERENFEKNQVYNKILSYGEIFSELSN